MNSSIDEFNNNLQNKYSNDMDSYNFLILSLYFYLNRNDYKDTSNTLFNECKLNTIFKFPQELKPAKNEKEKMINEFIEFFYQNSFFDKDSNFDLLGDFWNNFWGIFANKMHNGNSGSNETLFEKEKNNLMNLVYSEEKIMDGNNLMYHMSGINNVIGNNNSQNIEGLLMNNPGNSNLNNNNCSANNNINLRTINNLTGISNITNNNINTEDIGNIIHSSDSPSHINNNNININDSNNLNKINNNNSSMNNNNENNNINKLNPSNKNNYFCESPSPRKYFDQNINNINNNIKQNSPFIKIDHINIDNNLNINLKDKNNTSKEKLEKISNKSQSNDGVEEEEEEENDVEKEMDEENGMKFNKHKNNNSIIKRDNNNNNYYESSDIYNGIEHDIGPMGHLGGFSCSGMRQEGSQSNLNINSGVERVMSAIPLQKELQPQHNNQNFFEDEMK